jgi:hypothetical protein
VTWGSSNTAVATVSSNGLATGTGAGSTTVSASSGGLTANATLTVTVPSAVNGLLATLLVNVTGVGTGNSLANKVTAVQAALAVPNIATACTLMDDFTSQVAAQSGHQIPAPLAAQLTADANEINAAIPCP